jgi:hypothetical protein
MKHFERCIEKNCTSGKCKTERWARWGDSILRSTLEWNFYFENSNFHENQGKLIMLG